MIKTLSRCIGQYKKESVIAPIFAVLEMSFEIIIPFLTSKLVDYGIDKADMHSVYIISFEILCCALLSILCGYICGKTSAIAAAGFAKNIRQKMYASVQNFSFFNIDKYSSASIITRLTTDVVNVQSAYQTLMFVAPVAPALLIFSLIFSFKINVSLSLIFLGFIPVLAVALYFIIFFAHKIFKKVFRTYDKLNEVVEENLNGIRVVKSFAREDFEKNKFFKISNKIYKNFLKGEKIVALNMPVMQFCMYMCTIFTAWFGARMIVASNNDPNRGLTTGQLLSFISYSSQILMGLMILSMVLTMITISLSSAKRIVEILNEKSNITNPSNAISVIRDGSIKFDNVGFSYVQDKNNLCIQNINLDIKSGEIIGITGGTGSGKSTLVHLIPRLYDATVGNVFVGGINVKNYDINFLRNNVAVVLQKNTLFSGTVAENLRWGNECSSDEELVKVCKLAQADEFIKTMPKKYETMIERGGANISGGQKQRICIARALLKNPKILILDDSTSALDTKTEALIRNSFKESLPHTTKLIISQRISSIKHADRIVVMDNGRVVAFDKHEQLLKECPIYKEIYNLQQKSGEQND